MKTLFNPSSLNTEKANLIKCIRCSGFGGIAFEDDRCYLYKGHGKVWSTGNGAYRAKYSRVTQYY